jgi:hypothetical protein
MNIINFKKLLVLFFPVLLYSCNSKNNIENISLIDVNNLLKDGIIINERENITYLKNSKNRENSIDAYFNYLIIYNINKIQNNSIKILLNTREGCSKTNFIIKPEFYFNLEHRDNIFFISTIDELKYLKDKYFILPFFESFSENYFENNNLILITTGYNGSSELRNERIEDFNGKKSFIIEYWYRGTGDGLIFTACAMTRLYVLETQ